MLVRIQFPQGTRKGSRSGRNAPLVSVLGGLIMLVAISCLGLGMWRLTSDLGWTGTFAIPEGLLSHWQVWLAMAVAFGAAALRLQRYGRPPEQIANQSLDPPAKPKIKDRAATR
jgi:hypothetical protein